ncbi:TPA: hypothetical protein ACIVG6_001900 [Salmonella enterica subsp. enterica serovar Virchow]
MFTGVLLLSGCMSTDYLDNGLQSLTGKPIEVAFQYLGYPDQKQSFDDLTVYTWRRAENSVDTYIAPQTTTGKTGEKTVRLTSTEMQYVPVTKTCKIQLAVDKTGYIKNYNYEDNNGCYFYYQRLEPLVRMVQ